MARSGLTAGHGGGRVQVGSPKFQPLAPCCNDPTLTGDEAGVVAHAQTPPEKQVLPPRRCGQDIALPQRQVRTTVL